MLVVAPDRHAHRLEHPVQGARAPVALPIASKEATVSSLIRLRKISRIAAATLAALALAAPVASAQPIVDPPTTSPIELDLSAYDATPTPPVTIRATDNGFDWGSAGLGAAAVGALVLIAVGGFTAAHRARIRVAR
jgi:hypothetical protein